MDVREPLSSLVIGRLLESLPDPIARLQPRPHRGVGPGLAGDPVAREPQPVLGHGVQQLGVDAVVGQRQP